MSSAKEKVRTPVNAWAWPGRTHLLAVDRRREGLILRLSPASRLEASSKGQCPSGTLVIWTVYQAIYSCLIIKQEIQTTTEALGLVKEGRRRKGVSGKALASRKSR